MNAYNQMKEAIRNILYQIYRLFPKHNHAVIWGWPPGEDNSRALIDRLQHKSVSQIILLVPEEAETKAAFREPGNRIRVVLKDGWRCWLWFLTARYVFFTHRCLMRKFPDSVVSVNMWHGMPFKKIGALLANDEGIRSRYVLATSDFWTPIMEQAMRPLGKVLTTGLPRNDRLFSDRAAVRRKLGVQDREDVRRIVAWLPTYRKSVRGEIREDGLESGSVFGIDDADPQAINEFGRAHDMLVWVKPHPMSPFEQIEEHSHLLIVGDAWLMRKNLSLYETLGASDALISDISSVAVDYLLLDRPIVHSFPDIEAYRHTRGFTVEPIEDYFMGPTTKTWEEAKRELKRIFNGEDPGRENRQAMRELFHKHKDGQATRRLMDELGIA